MAFYAMSDLHGMYDKYREMLELIRFSEEDELFILGDVVDRGSKPMEILLDMMQHPNIYPLYGNHDVMALNALTSVAEAAEKNGGQLDPETASHIFGWCKDGGMPTVEGFLGLSETQRDDVLSYLREFSLYEMIDVRERTFLLVHAGLGNFRKGKKLREYTIEELLQDRSDPEIQYFEDDSIFVVTGHTPTPHIWGKAEIYKSHNNFCIDCAAFWEKGRLACLRLDDLAEFYV